MYLWIKKSIGKTYSYLKPEIRWAPEFNKIITLLLESENWSKDKLDEFQYEKTKAILKHAEKNVPWYKKKFAEWGVHSCIFKEISDIKKFPCVTKEEMRDNLSQFLSNEAKTNKLKYVTTGGSTGIPFGFYQSRAVLNIESAFFSYHWGWYGCRHQIDKSVVLRGSFVGDEQNLFSYSPRTNEWHFSTYYLTEKNFDKYFNKLNSIKPKFIQAYPSAAELFAKYMLSYNKTLDFHPEAIMCGSENLYQVQKDIIEKAFQTKIHCWYGQAEKVCLAPWTKNSQLYHILPQYGLIELVDNSGKELNKENEIGEIIATSFYNFDMPFIRYKSMDMATFSNQISPDYPNYKIFSKINGRLQELFITGNGRLISMTAINMHDNIFDELRQFQFYQDTPGELIMNVIPKGDLSDSAISNIRNKMINKLGSDVKLEIRIVENIPKTKSGKLRFLIQKIPINHSGIIESVE